MGLAIDSNETFDFVFELDADKPEAVRPSLTFRYCSSRDCRKIQALFVLADETKTDDEFCKYIEDAVKTVLVGWKNQGINYSVDDIDAVLRRDECSEIRWSLLGRMTMSAIDRKKSKRQSRLNTTKSAFVAVGAVVADVQPSISQPNSSVPSATVTDATNVTTENGVSSAAPVNS